MHGVRTHPNIKVNHQIHDVISLDSVSQVTIFKQKNCVEIFLSRKANISFSLVATGNCASSHDAKSPALKAIACSSKLYEQHFVFSRCRGQP